MITDKEWLDQAPELPAGLPPHWKHLWRECWALHQRSSYPAIGLLDDTWESLGAGYFMPAFGHWDIVHCALDHMVYDLEFAKRQIRLIIRTLRESDGRLQGLFRVMPGENGAAALEVIYNYSPPPVWPIAAAALAERTRDLDFTRMAYNGAVRCLDWYEQNRSLPNGLFWYADCIEDQRWESGYDEAARFDGCQGKTEPFACVDLSAQMGMFYDSLASMADILSDDAAAVHWRSKSSALAERVRVMLWHESDGLFYDRNPKTETWVRVNNIACFWPMIAGQATPEQATRLANHLANPDEYFCALPVPSVALNDPTFELDCWRGPTWLSQTYWCITGLKRYGFHDLAGAIAAKALDGAAAVLAKSGCLFEFYHPLGGDQTVLKRKKSPRGPCKNYIGHNPLHAIACSIISD